LSEDLKDFIRKCLTSDELKRLCLAEFQNHPFILRITEGDGIPQLLRKPTSWNEPSGKECITSTSKETSEKHILENMTAEPSSLHHRKNPQSKPKTEKQFTSQINLMRYLYRFLEQLPLVEDNLPCIIGLKFLATKQMLSLLQCLQCTIRGGENIFNFEGWDEFVGSAEKSNYYK
jgi:serine/threonine protein kinase